MGPTRVREFLDRVVIRIPELSGEKFSHTSWRVDDRPTSEVVGLLPGVEVDLDRMVERILDMDSYPGNIKYVVESKIISRVSAGDFVFVQKVNLPLLGGVQGGIHMVDFGDVGGFRALAWEQDDAVTDGLDQKHGGARLAYNFGAWLLKRDAVGYALSSAPRKQDVGALKFAVMTKGADATAGDVIKGNISGMIAWSQRD